MASLFQKSVTYLLMLSCLYHIAESQSRLCGRALADTLDMVCAGRGFHLGKRSVRSILEPYTHELDPYESRLSDKPIRPARIMSQPELRRGNSFLSLLDSKPASNNLASNLGAVEEPGFSRSSNLPLSRESSESLEADLAGITALTSKEDRQANGDDVDNGNGRRELVDPRQERVRRSGTSIVDECCLQTCTFATLESYCAAADEPVEELSMDELRMRLGLSVGRDAVTAEGEGRGRYAAPRMRPSAEIIRNRGPNRSGPFFYLSLGNQATRSPLIE